MSHLLISNIEWLVTVDRERRVIRDGAVLIADGVITAVGKSSDLTAPIGTKNIDGRGLLAIPGLIDCSVAVTQQLGRGIGDLCDIPKYRLERVAPYEAALTTEDANWAARSCLLEMIRAGTTCFVDSGGMFPDQVTDAAVQMGLRGVISRACQDVFKTPMGDAPASQVRESTGDVLTKAEAAAQHIRDRKHSRVHPALAVPWLAGCSDELGASLAQLAKREGLSVIVSAAANRDEAVMARMHHRKTEVARLADLQLLGPRTLVSHAGWTSPQDLRRLRDTQATVVCCPSSSHRLGTGALENGRFPELIEFGASVTLGSGSAMASNFVDVARQLYLFAGGNKTFRLDATVTPPEMVIEMATIRAAASLGLETEIGSLEVGKQADIALFRCFAADWVPVINPLQNLVFSARGGADTVIVAGDVLMQGGTVRIADEALILSECQSRAEALASRAGLSEFLKPAWKVV